MLTDARLSVATAMPGITARLPHDKATWPYDLQAASGETLSSRRLVQLTAWVQAMNLGFCRKVPRQILPRTGYFVSGHDT